MSMPFSEMELIDFSHIRSALPKCNAMHHYFFWGRRRKKASSKSQFIKRERRRVCKSCHTSHRRKWPCWRLRQPKYRTVCEEHSRAELTAIKIIAPLVHRLCRIWCPSRGTSSKAAHVGIKVIRLITWVQRVVHKTQYLKGFVSPVRTWLVNCSTSAVQCCSKPHNLYSTSCHLTQMVVPILYCSTGPFLIRVFLKLFYSNGNGTYTVSF